MTDQNENHNVIKSLIFVQSLTLRLSVKLN